VKGATIGNFSRICGDFVHKLTSQSYYDECRGDTSQTVPRDAAPQDYR
jgi:hypothetical protein